MGWLACRYVPGSYTVHRALAELAPQKGADAPALRNAALLHTQPRNRRVQIAAEGLRRAGMLAPVLAAEFLPAVEDLGARHLDSGPEFALVAQKRLDRGREVREQLHLLLRAPGLN